MIGTQRRSAAPRAHRVAVWDVNYVFPEIEPTIAALNDAQARFDFTLVHTSAPVGTWRFAGQQLHIYANHVARKLKGKTSELSADYLFCITDKLIDYTDRDGTEYQGFYGWWSEESDTDIADDLIIFSTAIKGLPLQGNRGARTLTNALVMGLAARMSGLDCHDLRGARSEKEQAVLRRCPLFWNPSLNAGLASGEQRFDAGCARHLARKVPDDFPALQAMLRTFDAHPEAPPSTKAGKRQDVKNRTIPQ